MRLADSRLASESGRLGSIPNQKLAKTRRYNMASMLAGAS
jgi:hypothetical protein